MATNELTIQKIETRDISEQLSGLVDHVDRGGRRIVIARSGVPVAALVPMDDLARLDEFDREWEEGTRALERFGAAFADIPPDEAEAEIARIIDERRQRRRCEAQRQTT